VWSDWPRQGLMVLVKGYRLLLSPWLGSSCRFEPSCSVYALGALERHGALAATSRSSGWAVAGHGAKAATTLSLPRRPRCFPV
jgi:putative component of membrane protein insertase Oxa1/YidC/SpoIIIJ protein YidD